MKETCKAVLERAYLYLDGEILSEAERVEIQGHLEECAPCLERVGIEREVITVLVARLKGQCRCPEGLRSRVQQLLDQA